MTECKKKQTTKQTVTERTGVAHQAPRALFTPHLKTGELFKTGVEDTERLKRTKFTRNFWCYQHASITTFLAALTADKLPYFPITLFSQIMIIISSLSFPGYITSSQFNSFQLTC